MGPVIFVRVENDSAVGCPVDASSHVWSLCQGPECPRVRGIAGPNPVFVVPLNRYDVSPATVDTQPEVEIEIVRDARLLPVGQSNMVDLVHIGDRVVRVY